MRHIVKVDTTSGMFRIVIPKNLIREKRWIHVNYVFIESGFSDTFTIRRFVDVEEDKTDG